MPSSSFDLLAEHVSWSNSYTTNLSLKEELVVTVSCFYECLRRQTMTLCDMSLYVKSIFTNSDHERSSPLGTQRLQ